MLGSGGMGIVHEAIDHHSGDKHVALKELRSREPAALDRFKREFQLVHDLPSHRNLVELYDRFIDGETHFFTMERVTGVDFFQWVWPGEKLASRDQPTASLEAPARPAAPAVGALLDRERLSKALRQLALGVAHLHSHGCVHRDLKPQNVLVTSDGTVRILDFGLAAQLNGERSISEEQGRAITGTLRYMAPEQGGTAPPTVASDWYAVGAMLYQVLTGRLPFEEEGWDLVDAKRSREAPGPSERARDVPAELDQLCRRLLRRNPAERPGLAEILQTLGAPLPPAPAAPSEPGLVGRKAELQVLREALAQTQREPRVVRVLGGSGVGKTALLKHFLDQVRAEGSVALSGRCYERESVPFKALDSAIDALGRYLGKLDGIEAAALVPRDGWALARMFPVLLRVPAVERSPQREVTEPNELLRRATTALREILGGISDRATARGHRLVLFIDDLQWGDADSAALLDEVLKAPDAPAMLVVVTSRDPAAVPPGPHLAPITLELAALSRDEAVELARCSLPEESRHRAEHVAHESGGNPALLQQLALFGAEARLDDVVLRRAAALDAPTRRLLDAVCLSGHPVDASVALSAAGFGRDDGPIRQLKGARLIRGTLTGARERLEPWHDRIREAVAAILAPPVQQQLHLALAEAMERHTPDQDLDTWAGHLLGGGRTEAAAQATARAAGIAAEQLAFERAATLYGTAIGLLPAGAPERHPLRVALGDCLANAGRGGEAAEAYALALPTAAPAQALELERRRCEELLRSGHVEEGIGALTQVLAKGNMTLARKPWRALAALLFRRALLALRGLEFVERDEASADPVLLRKIDLCWSVAMGLAMIDTLRGASFQTRGLLIALEVGEPYRLARALTAEAIFVATAGHRAEARALDLLGRAKRLAARVGDPQLTALVEFSAGSIGFLVGRWRDAHTHAREAERLLDEAGAPVSWEAASARVFELWSLFYLGELKEAARRQPALLHEARRRGDLYSSASLQTGLAIITSLAADEPRRARESVREMAAQWGSSGFTFQHYWSMLAEGMIELYEGDFEACWDRMERGRSSLRWSGFLQIQNVRIESRFLRAFGALGSGRLGEALEAARQIEGEGTGWARAFAALIRGSVAAGKGRNDRAGPLLGRAVALFEQHDMTLFAAAARIRWGELEGGEPGAARVKEGQEAMIAQGVQDPVAMTRLLAAPAPLPVEVRARSAGRTPAAPPR